MITQIDLVLTRYYQDWFEILISQNGVKAVCEEYSADLTDDKVKELKDVLTKYLEEREREKRRVSE